MRLHASRQSAIRVAIIGLALAGLSLWGMTRGAQAQGGTVKVEWLSWSFFRFTSPTGKVILTNPFITREPGRDREAGGHPAGGPDPGAQRAPR